MFAFVVVDFHVLLSLVGSISCPLMCFAKTEKRLTQFGLPCTLFAVYTTNECITNAKKVCCTAVDY